VEFRVVLLGFQANDAILHGNFQNDGDLRRVRNEMRDEFRERFIQGRIVDVLRMIVAPPWQRLYTLTLPWQSDTNLVAFDLPSLIAAMRTMSLTKKTHAWKRGLRCSALVSQTIKKTKAQR
jgi:hypothetical protein